MNNEEAGKEEITANPAPDGAKDAEGQGWFSPDCPHCGSSRTVGTNKAERAGALLGGLATALVAGAIVPVAAPVGYAASKAICDHADYICLNCRKSFSVQR